MEKLNKISLTGALFEWPPVPGHKHGVREGSFAKLEMPFSLLKETAEKVSFFHFPIPRIKL